MSHIHAVIKNQNLFFSIFFSDKQAVDEDLLKILPFDQAAADQNADFHCVGYRQLQLVTYPCSDPTYFTNKEEKDTNKPALGYICEAKLLETPGSQSCSIPFKHEGITYDSCSFKDIDTPTISPWCPTETDENGNAISPTISPCLDERSTILDGNGSGHVCPMPFLFDRVYHDYCSRKDFNQTKRYAEFFWCPDPRKISGDNNLYEPKKPVGQCPKFLHPVENGCPETYEALDENVCVRISAFPETYQDAKAKCASEGSVLFQHTNNEKSVSFFSKF